MCHGYLNIIDNIESELFLTGCPDKKKIQLLESLSNTDYLSSQENAFIKKYIKRVSTFTSSNINESFFNPFDYEEQHKKTTADILVPEMTKYTGGDGVKIQKVRLWNHNVADKTYYDKGGVYSGRFFNKRDIIEKCPVKYLELKDLYSPAIRKFAFSIDKSKNLYAVPFGKAVFYANSLESGKQPNVSYEFDTDGDGHTDGYIIIKAINKIRPNDELIILSDENDFENLMDDNMFDYKTAKDDGSTIIKNDHLKYR